MFFYISARPINIDGKRMLTPKYALGKNFPGLIKSWKCICSNIKSDGRYLYEVEVGTTEHRDVIIEGLAMWGCHLKTEASTLLLMQILTGRDDSTFINGRLSIPNIGDIA